MMFVFASNVPCWQGFDKSEFRQNRETRALHLPENLLSSFIYWQKRGLSSPSPVFWVAVPCVTAQMSVIFFWEESVAWGLDHEGPFPGLHSQPAHIPMPAFNPFVITTSIVIVNLTCLVKNGKGCSLRLKHCPPSRRCLLVL